MAKILLGFIFALCAVGGNNGPEGADALELKYQQTQSRLAKFLNYLDMNKVSDSNLSQISKDWLLKVEANGKSNLEKLARVISPAVMKLTFQEGICLDDNKAACYTGNQTNHSMAISKNAHKEVRNLPEMMGILLIHESGHGIGEKDHQLLNLVGQELFEFSTRFDYIPGKDDPGYDRYYGKIPFYEQLGIIGHMDIMAGEPMFIPFFYPLKTSLFKNSNNCGVRINYNPSYDIITRHWTSQAPCLPSADKPVFARESAVSFLRYGRMTAEEARTRYKTELEEPYPEITEEQKKAPAIFLERIVMLDTESLTYSVEVSSSYLGGKTYIKVSEDYFTRQNN